MEKVLSVDFDGVIVKNAYPEIGEPMEGAFEALQEIKNFGYKLILWTCRENHDHLIDKQYLTDAVEFCRQNGIEFDAINTFHKETDFRPEHLPNRKPYAKYYIDDCNFGGFPGWDAIKKVVLFQHTADIRVMPTIQRENRLMHDNFNFGETRKAYKRRLDEGWFDKYAPADKPGLDIGCQFDPINHTFRRWDILFGDGDANTLEGVPDETYFTVYASHILEHISKPVKAVKEWFRVLQKGGHLIVVIPHRDLYEKRKTLPSQWNPEHKWFWLPDISETPCTISVKDLMTSSLPDGEVVSLKVLDSGYDYSLPINAHPVGEFSIEVIVKKIS